MGNISRYVIETIYTTGNKYNSTKNKIEQHIVNHNTKTTTKYSTTQHNTNVNQIKTTQ